MLASQQPLIPEITPQQAANILAVSRKTVYRLIASGELPVRRLAGHSRGGQYRIPQDEVLALRHGYQQQAKGPAAPSLPLQRRGLADLELIHLDAD